MFCVSINLRYVCAQLVGLHTSKRRWACNIKLFLHPCQHIVILPLKGGKCCSKHRHHLFFLKISTGPEYGLNQFVPNIRFRGTVLVLNNFTRRLWTPHSIHCWNELSDPLMWNVVSSVTVTWPITPDMLARTWKNWSSFTLIGPRI